MARGRPNWFLEGSKGESHVPLEEERHGHEQSSCVEMLVARPRGKETAELGQRVAEEDVREVRRWGAGLPDQLHLG